MGEFHKAVILGGGPAGLTAGLYLMRGGIETVLVEKGILGGTPMKYERVENYPGFPDGVACSELMARMAEQARRFGLVTKEFSEVEEVSFDGSLFHVKAGEAVLDCMGVIVASGTESVKLGIPGEEELLGRGVSYCATCDGAFFRNLEVAVVGGGDAAVQEALALTHIVKKVYIIHRRDTLRAQKVIQERAFANEKIEFIWNAVPIEVRGRDQVESILLEDKVNGQRSELRVDGVFVYVGAKPATAILGDLVERDSSGFVVTGESLETKTAGLFVAGDARKKTLRQITTAVGDGALAAVNLERYISEKR